MVRDGSSGNDDKLDHERDADAVQQPERSFAQDVPTQLTQELARLLAVSIAQSQGGKGFPVGVPTGSELASLASLVSAASGQRQLAPVFKDGLSALSYTSARTQPLPAVSPAPPDPSHDDDEPMPIPSTWRQPSYDEDRWFRQQLGATLLGLVAGLIVVVPAVLWLTGWIGPQKGKSGIIASATTASMDVRPERKPEPSKTQTKAMETAAAAQAAQYVTGSIEPRGSVELRKLEQPAPPAVPAAALAPPALPTPPPAPKVEEQRPRVEDLITQAMRRAESGDVASAREMLTAAEGSGPGGPISFALAETYDPNKLAAWGTRGVSADAVKARALYNKALNLGVTRAKERLDALE
jgi:hypothetical protein